MVARPYNPRLGKSVQAFAVAVIPAGARHERINERFDMLIRQSQILPCVDAEIGSVHMDMETAALVHFDIAGIQHPAYGFQFLQAFLADQYRTDQFECIPALEAAVGHQLPVSPCIMIVAFHDHMDSSVPEFSGKPLAGTVVGFDLYPGTDG